MTSKIQVSPQIADQLEQVRCDGRFNMLDRNGVQWAANDLGLYELVVWIEDLPRRDYRRVIMQGVEVIDEEEDRPPHR